MQRSYRRERYLGWLDRIRTAIPDVAVSTDIIVGFPGETERDFEQTLEVVEAARFDSAYTFQYSPRPGTRAAGFDEQVPKSVVQERFDRLVALQERISTENATRSSAGRWRCWSRAATARGGRPSRARARTASCTSASDSPGNVRRRARSWTPLRITSSGELDAAPAAVGPEPPAMPTRPPLLALVGPTASGKTEAGIELARSRSAPRSARSTRCSSTEAWTSAPRSRPPSSARGCRTT